MVFLIHTELRCTVNHTSDLQIWFLRVWHDVSNVLYWFHNMGRGSSVGIATTLRAGLSGDRSPVAGRGFPRPFLGPIHPHVRGAFNNLSTWLRKKRLITKKNIFYFQCSPLIAQYTFAHFCCNDFIPLEKKSFDYSSNQVVTASLTSSSLENRLPRKIFHNSE